MITIICPCCNRKLNISLENTDTINSVFLLEEDNSQLIEVDDLVDSFGICIAKNE